MSSIRFDGTAGEDAKYNSMNDRLVMKIVEIIKTEIAKTETQQKLRCAVDPLVGYLLHMVQPYVTVLSVLIVLILVCQGYLIHKIWTLRL